MCNSTALEHLVQVILGQHPTKALPNQCAVDVYLILATQCLFCHFTFHTFRKVTKKMRDKRSIL